MRAWTLSLFFNVTLCSSLQAADFIVDTSSDAVLSACTAAPADCSLRGAIAAANATPATDRVLFDLPESDAGFVAADAYWRIELGGPLQITAPLIVDGFSQSGAAPNTLPPLSAVAHRIKIQLLGAASGNDTCLLAVAALTLRGLALGRCHQAVFLFEPGPHVIEGNHIGLAPDGRTLSANRVGVALGGDARIGGALPAQANVISGNRLAGLSQTRSLTRLRVQGNVLGGRASLDAVAGPQDYGIQLTSSFTDALIGGTDAGEANWFLGHHFNALYAFPPPESASGAPQLRVLGNLFGVGINGAPFGNGHNPSSPSQPQPTLQIQRQGRCRVAIGGDAPGEGNLIAYGGGAGIAVSNCWQAPILGNSFLANRGLVIDLATSNGFDGPTPNDAGDVDGGNDPMQVAAGNRLQNTADILELIDDAGASEVRVRLRIDSQPSASTYPLRIDFLGHDISGAWVPETTASYPLEAAQQARDYVLPLAPFARGLAIVVTDAAGNTSELLTTGRVFGDGFEAL